MRAVIGHLFAKVVSDWCISKKWETAVAEVSLNNCYEVRQEMLLISSVFRRILISFYIVFVMKLQEKLVAV